MAEREEFEPSAASAQCSKDWLLNHSLSLPCSHTSLYFHFLDNQWTTPLEKWNRGFCELTNYLALCILSSSFHLFVPPTINGIVRACLGFLNKASRAPAIP